jgi:hypothetical protein
VLIILLPFSLPISRRVKKIPTNKNVLAKPMAAIETKYLTYGMQEIACSCSVRVESITKEMAMKARLTLLALAFFVVRAPGAAENENEPKIPDKLKIPAGHVLLFKTQAEGVQIYRSTEEDGKLIWKFKAPLAFLLQEGQKAGYHYAGPTWEAPDGSKVQIDKIEEPANDKSPNSKPSVDWLRIKVKSSGANKGKFASVTYILRLETEGGVAPALKAEKAGIEVGIPYKATYYFFGPK